MKKVLFTTLSIIAVAAMMMVSCKKEPVEKPDDNKEEQKVDDDLVGTWTITGEAYGWDQTKGVAMTESDNVWTAAEVSIKGEGIKFVKDASWDVNLGAKEDGAKEDDVEFELEKGGKNIKGAKDGVYSVTLNLLTKKAKIKFVKDLEPDPIVVKTWAEAEEAEAINFFQYWTTGDWGNPTVPATEADSFDNVSFADGVYTYNITNGAPELWMAQLFLRPNPKKAYLPLAADKFYRVSITIESSAAMTPWVKFTQYDPKENEDHNSENYKKHEGGCFVEWGDVALEANTPHTFAAVIKVSEALACNNVNWTLGLGGHNGATIKISNIVVEETEEPAAVLELTESILPEASYPTAKTLIRTLDGEEFYVMNVATFPAYGGKFQMKKNGGYFANRTAFGKIESIKVYCQSDKSWYPTNLTLYAGTTEVPVENAIEGTSDSEAKTGTYDLSGGDYQYFNLVNTSGYAVYLEKIEISFKGGMTTPALVTIDGNLDEWAVIPGATEGIHTIKAYSDATNVYFYSHRDKDSRFSEIWGGAGYLYIGLDVDGDETNGESLWGNGPYDFVGVTYPYGGTAEAPAIVEASGANGACVPEKYSVAAATCKGVIDENGVTLEYSIPRANLPEFTKKVTLKSWGNKDLSKATLTCVL